MRVNTRYLNSTRGTASKRMPPTPHPHTTPISGTLGDTGVHRHKTEQFFLFKAGHSPLILKLVQHINTQIHTFTCWKQMSVDYMNLFMPTARYIIQCGKCSRLISRGQTLKMNQARLLSKLRNHQNQQHLHDASIFLNPFFSPHSRNKI